MDFYPWWIDHIPSINSDQFYSQDPSPQNTQWEDPSDNKLIDYGEDEDILANEFAEDDLFS